MTALDELIITVDGLIFLCVHVRFLFVNRSEGDNDMRAQFEFNKNRHFIMQDEKRQILMAKEVRAAVVIHLSLFFRRE